MSALRRHGFIISSILSCIIGFTAQHTQETLRNRSETQRSLSARCRLSWNFIRSCRADAVFREYAAYRKITASDKYAASAEPKPVPATMPSQSLRKQYFEHHFAGMHPAPSPEFGGARAGSKLFQIREDRAQALAARIHQSATEAVPNSSVPAVLPGLAQHQPLSGAGTIPTAMVTGDFNNDGHLDFAVTNGGSNDIWIYFGNRDNTFQLPRIVPLHARRRPGLSGSRRSAAAASWTSWSTRYQRDQSASCWGMATALLQMRFSIRVPNTAGAVAVNDFNHDGKPDIAVVLVNTSPTTAAQQIAVLPGSGDGTFGQPIISDSNNVFGEKLAIQATIDSGDINEDGYADLLLVQPMYQTPGGIISDVVVPYINNGDGTFTEGAPLIHYNGIDYLTDARLADINNDGCPDAVISDLAEVVWVGLGDCSGNFGTLKWFPMGDASTTVRVADVNGDGNLDLVTGSAFVEQANYTYPLVQRWVWRSVMGREISVRREYIFGSSEESAIAVGDFAGNARPSIA